MSDPVKEMAAWLEHVEIADEDHVGGCVVLTAEDVRLLRRLLARAEQFDEIVWQARQAWSPWRSVSYVMKAINQARAIVAEADGEG